MKPPEDMSARVERLAPRLRTYVRSLEQQVAAMKAQLGDGPHELDTYPGSPPRRLPDGEFKMFNRDKRWLSLKLEKDGLGFRLYGSGSMVVAFSSTNLARVSVEDVISDLAYHCEPCSSWSKRQLKERFPS